jgi:hypothetical protein
MIEAAAFSAGTQRVRRRGHIRGGNPGDDASRVAIVSIDGGG